MIINTGKKRWQSFFNEITSCTWLVIISLVYSQLFFFRGLNDYIQHESITSIVMIATDPFMCVCIEPNNSISFTRLPVILFFGGAPPKEKQRITKETI